MFARFTLALGVASLAIGLTAGLASAHARYDSSTPAAGATVASAPATVQVAFTEELSQARLTITGPGGVALFDGPATIDLEHRTNASAAVKDGGGGQYTVVWHNVSGDDGDPNDGSFTFTVAATAASAPVSAPASTPAPVAAAACADNGQVTPGIADERVNTYCKRQAIREANKGKIDEVVFNELLSDGVGLDSALQEAKEAMSGGGD